MEKKTNQSKKQENQEKEKKTTNNTKSRLKDLKDLLKTNADNSLTITDITPADDSNTPLNHQQMLFIDEYLKDFNGARACIRAGYSENGASQTASRLLTYNTVKEEIARRQRELAKITNVTVENATKELYDFIQELYTDENVDRRTQLKALETIYKLNGLFNDTYLQQINIQNNNINEIKINIVKPNTND